MKPTIERVEGERMCFACVGSFYLILHTKEAPGDAEWEVLLRAVGRVPEGVKMTALVFTDGGSPTKTQREPLQALIKLRDARVAVVSPSATARFVISSLVLFGMKIRGYAPDSWRTAFAQLKMSREEQEQCERTLEELWDSGFGPQFATWTAARRS